jgi:hypothetical protein
MKTQIHLGKNTPRALALKRRAAQPRYQITLAATPAVCVYSASDKTQTA